MKTDESHESNDPIVRHIVDKLYGIMTDNKSAADLIREYQAAYARHDIAEVKRLREAILAWRG